MSFAGRVFFGGSAMTLVFCSRLLGGCIETGTPGDTRVSYVKGSRPFSATDYQTSPAPVPTPASNAGRGAGGSRAGGMPPSTAWRRRLLL